MAPIARPASARLCWTAYVLALLASTLVHPVIDALDPTMGFLWRGLVLNTVATVVVYLFSLWSSNSSVYDPYWAVAPLALSLYWKAHAPGGFFSFEPRGTIGLVLLWTWAVRFFVLVPWDGWTRGIDHEDWRYVQIRSSMPNEVAYWCFSLSSLHLTPTLLVYAGLCPLGRVILLGDTAPALTPVDAIGAALTLTAVAIEAVADEQLRRHRAGLASERPSSNLSRDPTSNLSPNPTPTQTPTPTPIPNPSPMPRERALATCRTGLWRCSRHPNYCGECLFWTGLLVLASGSGVVASEPLLCTGAALIWAFFRFASVPLMDARSLQRRPDYGEVMATTSALLLWPPKAKPASKSE